MGEGVSTDLVPLLRDALVDVERVMAAFVFGSVAQGTHREDSDLDLFVLAGPDFDRRRFYLQLTEVGLLADHRCGGSSGRSPCDRSGVDSRPEPWSRLEKYGA